MSQESRDRLLEVFGQVTDLNVAGSDLDDMTQIKVLQIMMMFLDPNQAQLSKQTVNSVLKTCF